MMVEIVSFWSKEEGGKVSEGGREEVELNQLSSLEDGLERSGRRKRPRYRLTELLG